ncbi:Uncharacterised protein [Providencia alcalifaciens]|nr:Uncharacterised protein [Providencia alcalifaciens]
MNFITHKFFNLILVASVVGGTNINLAIAESANAIVQIKTTVLAGCTLDAPETVSLDNIPSSAFNGKHVGDNLTDYAKTFNLTATCSGTDNINTHSKSQNPMHPALKLMPILCATA